jgi:benzoyl-CoA reductase/2-hydroxyglutaryl-CoA dehydratase subunit BcrC/BadD/HgdB
MATVSEMIYASIAQLEKDLQSLRAEARRAGRVRPHETPISLQCAAAWDVVEEVQAAIADRRESAKTNFEQFCEDRPDAAECRVYDI